ITQASTNGSDAAPRRVATCNGGWVSARDFKPASMSEAAATANRLIIAARIGEPAAEVREGSVYSGVVPVIGRSTQQAPAQAPGIGEIVAQQDPGDRQQPPLLRKPRVLRTIDAPEPAQLPEPEPHAPGHQQGEAEHQPPVGGVVQTDRKSVV